MSFEFLKKSKTGKRFLIATLLFIMAVVIFHLISKNRTVCNIIEATCITMGDKTEDCINARKQGHTIRYLLVSLVVPNKLDNAPDPDLKNLLVKRPELPASWLKKMDWPQEEGCFVDEAGNELRSVLFVLVDGDIAWCYTLTYEANGTCRDPMEEKCDAKEYDPKYKTAIQEVNRKVNEELERKNIRGLGTCHSFWQLKKEHLKAEGIEWKSPSELNPNTMYD